MTAHDIREGDKVIIKTRKVAREYYVLQRAQGSEVALISNWRDGRGFVVSVKNLKKI